MNIKNILAIALLCTAGTGVAENSLHYYATDAAPMNWSDDSAIADDIWEYYKSSNLQWQLKPGNERTSHRAYRIAVRGPHIVLTYDAPKFLSINGNRDVIRDVWVSELVIGLAPETLFPNRLFGIKQDGSIVAFHKFQGHLGLELQKKLQNKTTASPRPQLRSLLRRSLLEILYDEGKTSYSPLYFLRSM